MYVTAKKTGEAFGCKKLKILIFWSAHWKQTYISYSIFKNPVILER